MEVSSTLFLADSTNNATIAKIVITTAVARTASRPAARLFKMIIEITFEIYAASRSVKNAMASRNASSPSRPVANGGLGILVHVPFFWTEMKM